MIATHTNAQPQPHTQAVTRFSFSALKCYFAADPFVPFGERSEDLEIRILTL